MKVSIEGSYAAIEVDLWGHMYETKEATRSVHRQVRELEQKADASNDEDEAMECLAEMFDVKLVPVSHKDDGKRPVKASTVVKKKWKDDELSLAKILRFFHEIGDAEETARPT